MLTKEMIDGFKPGGRLYYVSPIDLGGPNDYRANNIRIEVYNNVVDIRSMFYMPDCRYADFCYDENEVSHGKFMSRQTRDLFVSEEDAIEEIRNRIRGLCRC